MGRLYLQEKTHIIGMHPNRRNCARALVGFANTMNEPDRESPFRNVGIWELVGMTGDWAQAIGLYEFTGGWEGFNWMISQTMKEPSAALSAIYREVEPLRSGGSDEILEAMEGSPSLDELALRPPSGALLLHDVVQTEPGREEAYGDLFRTEWRPIAAAYDCSLIGLFKAPLMDGLVISYQVCDFARFGAMMDAPETAAWRRRAQGARLGWRRELWTAAPGSRFSDSGFDYGKRDILSY